MESESEINEDLSSSESEELEEKPVKRKRGTRKVESQ